jgi:phosphonate transport system substrate-binding protein
MKRSHSKRLVIVLLIFLLLPILPGCPDDEKALKIDMNRRETVDMKDAGDAVVTYAYLPQYSHTVAYERHHLLIEYLKKQTGLNIKQVFPDTFNEHVRMAGQGKIDISFCNPYVYVILAHRYGESAFAQVVESSGQKQFRGQIICRVDNHAIKTLDDCKGKRLIAVDMTSAGGYLYPMGHFYLHGIRSKDFAEISFSPGPGGKQEKVVLAVYAGQYDIGLIREGTLNVVADKIDLSQIRILAYSKWYPGWIYSARPNLNSEILSRIKDALFQLDYDNPDHRFILDKADFTGIVPTEDTEMESVRELLKMLGINLDR